MAKSLARQLRETANKVNSPAFSAFLKETVERKLKAAANTGEAYLYLDKNTDKELFLALQTQKGKDWLQEEELLVESNPANLVIYFNKEGQNPEPVETPTPQPEPTPEPVVNQPVTNIPANLVEEIDLIVGDPVLVNGVLNTVTNLNPDGSVDIEETPEDLVGGQSDEELDSDIPSIDLPSNELAPEPTGEDSSEDEEPVYEGVPENGEPEAVEEASDLPEADPLESKPKKKKK